MAEDPDGLSTTQFAAAFPARFTNALAEARGAMAGISASAANGEGLIPPEALQRLHEIYRLRIELEIETAAVLWRTAEIVCALTDAIESVNQRARPVPPPGGRWLGGIGRRLVEARRSRITMHDDEERRTSRWPDFGAPLASAPPETMPSAPPGAFGQRSGWELPRTGGAETEAA